MSRPLVPLRVPSGWAVLFNNFVEISDVEELSLKDADTYLSEDLLSIEQVRLADGRWQTIPDGVLLDLSWSEPGRLDGEYVLSVVQGGWDGPTATFRHRDGQRVRAAIDRTFIELLGGRAVPELGEIFDDPAARS